MYDPPKILLKLVIDKSFALAYHYEEDVDSTMWTRHNCIFKGYRPKRLVSIGVKVKSVR